MPPTSAILTSTSPTLQRGLWHRLHLHQHFGKGLHHRHWWHQHHYLAILLGARGSLAAVMTTSKPWHHAWLRIHWHLWYHWQHRITISLDAGGSPTYFIHDFVNASTSHSDRGSIVASSIFATTSCHNLTWLKGLASLLHRWLRQLLDLASSIIDNTTSPSLLTQGAP